MFDIIHFCAVFFSYSNYTVLNKKNPLKCIVFSLIRASFSYVFQGKMLRTKSQLDSHVCATEGLTEDEVCYTSNIFINMKN